MRKLLPIIFAFTGCLAIAQSNPSCGNGRYASEIFASATKTASAVTFGNNTPVVGPAQDLKLDVYEPTGDVATLRPAVFIGYGGSFIGGSRNDVASLCNNFARRGYVAVAYDYRLININLYIQQYFRIPDSTVMFDEVIKAVGDLKAAIRYIKHNASTYGVDTNFIFAGGVSAGAILSLHATHLDDVNEVPPFLQTIIANNGGLNGNTNNLNYTTPIKACFSLSGALYRTYIMDANDPPTASIHESGDGVVPFSWGTANVMGVPIAYLEGSQRVHQRADALGIPNYFISLGGNGHVGYANDATLMDSILNVSSRMFEAIICNHAFPPPLSADEVNDIAMRVYPNPANDLININLSDVASEVSIIKVSDQLGRVVLEQPVNNLGGTTVYRNGLPSGFYIISIYDNSQRLRGVSKVIFD